MIEVSMGAALKTRDFNDNGWNMAEGRREGKWSS